MSKAIPYARQWIDEDDIASVTEVLRSDTVTQGSALGRFEAGLARATGAAHAVAVSNGTAALHLACAVLGLKRGATGVTSPITFAASANCMRYCGAEVEFADVDPVTGLMDPESLDGVLWRLRGSGQPPGVVVAVSLAGRPMHLVEIREVTDRYGFRLIEDAAHSLGAFTGNGKERLASGSCRQSDAAILSFHPVKQICCGEGGALLTKSREDAERARRLRSHGIQLQASQSLPLDSDMPSWIRGQVELGWNYRMTEIQATLGLSQLKRLSGFLRRRRELAERYRKVLSREPFTGFIRLPPVEEGHAYHLFVIHFPSEKVRNEAHDYLKAKGIATQVHYLPVYRHPYYRNRMGKLRMPGAETYFRGCLSIPLYPMLTDDEQDRVIEAVGEFLQKRGFLQEETPSTGLRAGEKIEGETFGVCSEPRQAETSLRFPASRDFAALSNE